MSEPSLGEESAAIVRSGGLRAGRAEVALLADLSKAEVLIVGDVMLDEYLWGDVQRISPEAPVPVVDFRYHSHAVGGAGNAATNVVSLGGRALLGAVVGADPEADILRRELGDRRVDARLIACDRPTTTKTRVIGGSQQVLRIDREDRTQVPPEAQSELLDWAKQHLPSSDCVLISDYGKGVVTNGLCKELIRLARAEDTPVVVDPKGRDYSKYIGATVVTPNVTEVHSAAEPLAVSSGRLEDDVANLHSLLQETSFLVTRGAEGVSLFWSDAKAVHIPARARGVFDVTGAGDTFAATLALALGAGAALTEAAIMANAAAGVVVGKIGTAVVEPSELEAALKQL